MDSKALSRRYTVRALTAEDADGVLALCGGNPLYFAHCPPPATRESILRDMTALPPGVSPSDKHYVGFFDGPALVAVMDLITGFPQPSTAFIGFFMVDGGIQKKGVGTAIIGEVCDFLRARGFRSVRLAWIKGNPQAEHFWLKNRFTVIRETASPEGRPLRLARRAL